METLEKNKPIRSVSRALRVLQAINRHGTLNMTKISEAAGLAYPTTCRLVQTLVSEGVIEREPGRKFYRPTALAQSLSCGYQARSRMVAIARRHIEELTRQTGWPVSLSSRVGSQMVIQDSTHALTTLTFSEYPPGFSLPLLSCASGLAYLSALESSEREALLAQLDDIDLNNPLIRMIQSNSDAYFERVRQEGYAAFVKNQHTKDPGKTSSFAVPLFHGDDVVGSLALIFFSSSMSVVEAYEQYGAQVREAQTAISDDLLRMKLFKVSDLTLQDVSI